MIRVYDIFNMRGCEIKSPPPRTIPGRFASGVFLFIRFQIINIQANKAFLPPYFEDNPAALKFIVV